jgi:hypothetical protein
MRKADIHFPIVALAVIAACLTLATVLHADQSDQRATADLTTGWWRIVGDKPAHVTVFKPDGSFISGNIEADGSLRNVTRYDGTWKITNGVVTLTYTNFTYTRTLNLPINPKGTNGLNSNGQPMVMTRRAANTSVPGQSPVQQSSPDNTPAPSIPPEVQQAASAVIQTYHDSLVFVTGAAGSGSGFIATIGSANYLVTNVHVPAEIRDAAFKTLDGTVVQGGAPSMAVGEDIFCMAMPAGGKPFPIMQGVDANAAIGDYVVVLGNAEGAGVVNTLIGKIVGIGPNLVEIDAPFVPGNSGSPIVHLKTGKVIGVATYLVTNQYDLTTDQKLKKPVVRRFGYRLDGVKGWQAVQWPAFNAQAAQMEGIEALTDDLYDFFRDLDEHKGGVTPGRHTNPVIKTRIDDWLDAKSHNPSAQDADIADANFISFLKIACQSDITTAQRQVTYDYFRRELADQKQTRDQMASSFQEIIRALRQ